MVSEETQSLGDTSLLHHHHHRRVKKNNPTPLDEHLVPPVEKHVFSLFRLKINELGPPKDFQKQT